MPGYDPLRGVFRCRNCKYTAYVGIVFWPLRGNHAGLPADHVLTPGEAAELRVTAGLSYEAEERPPRVLGRYEGTRRIQRTNVECTCGEPCAVHGEGEGQRDGNDERGPDDV
jgi:hypothetical protein